MQKGDIYLLIGIIISKIKADFNYKGKIFRIFREKSKFINSIISTINPTTNDSKRMLNESKYLLTE